MLVIFQFEFNLEELGGEAHLWIKFESPTVSVKAQHLKSDLKHLLYDRS